MNITTNNNSVYKSAQITALDKAFIASGVKSIQLMKRAAEAAFDLLQNHYANLPVRIFCGGGNNAGDGYLLAGLLAQRKCQVDIVQLVPTNQLKNDALLACQFAQENAVNFYSLDNQPEMETGVLVDALLGIGAKGAPRAEFAKAIEWMNQSCLPIVALDLPSGLDADTGRVEGEVVNAFKTISFIALKAGLLTGRGPAVCGELTIADLQITEELLHQQKTDIEIIQLTEFLKLLKPRKADAHKGDFGHVMIIGGDTGYGGAALMAAEAAARTGAGKVSLATRPEHIAASLVRCPEVMACGVVSGQELEPLLSRPDLLVVGPGLGRSPWSEQMLQQAVKSGLPLVLDADALNILAEGRVIPTGTRGQWLLTPHPAEAARLLGKTTAEIQFDRFQSIKELHQRYDASVILKGAGSLVLGHSGKTGLVTAGNPGMATAGMGDVLSGILGGLLAQGLSMENAAKLGAVLHATAADHAVETTGQVGLMATDLIPYLCQIMREKS
jgi:ADP-dependent NAD(P)H-hydrate dehydratase / NAD(P)H-hydrate epimerase